MCILNLNLLPTYRTLYAFHSCHVVPSSNLYISYQESLVLSNIFVTPCNTILFYLLITSLFLTYLSSLQLQTVSFTFYENFHSLHFLNYLFTYISTCKIFLFNIDFNTFLFIFTITTRVHAIYTDRLLILAIDLYVQRFA